MSKKVGRKSKYDDFLAQDGLVLVTGWARNGLTDEQIAQNIGITRSTLYEWKNKYSDFSDALKKSKEYCDIQVENALYKKALMGDTTAMIFWLKNRQSDRWRDKVANDMNMKIESDGFIEALRGKAPKERDPDVEE
jgi:DNA-binding XRE family transcriptional regulator